MATETIFNCHEAPIKEYLRINGTSLISTYLFLQKLTPIKGFPKCSLLIMFIDSNLQSGQKYLCGLLGGRSYKFRPECNSALDPIHTKKRQIAFFHRL